MARRPVLLIAVALCTAAATIAARADDLALDPESAGMARELGLPALSDLGATRNRPLFTPSRRPPPRALILAAEPKEDEETEKPPFSLAGVVMGETMNVAMLRKADDTIELTRQGQERDGWRIEKVGPRDVLVSRGRSRVRLQLFEDKRPDAPR